LTTESSNRQLAVLLVVGSLLGLASVIIPYVLVHGLAGEYTSPLFPLLRNAWEKLEVVTTGVLSLFAGVVLGYVQPKHWFVLGGSTVSLLLLAAIAEMAKDPQSHNLWPIEFLLYLVVVGAPAIFGAFMGSLVRVRRNHRVLP
jgi:hypothetical protein